MSAPAPQSQPSMDDAMQYLGQPNRGQHYANLATIATLQSDNEQLRKALDAAQARERRLVDWAILYASEGQSWVFSSVTEQLVALSARAPTQTDADHFKTRGSLAALQSTPAVTG